MKKYIFMAVAGMLALSSCSNDDNDDRTERSPTDDLHRWLW